MVYEGHKTGMSETTFDKVGNLSSVFCSFASFGIYDLVMDYVSLVVNKSD